MFKRTALSLAVAMTLPVTAQAGFFEDMIDSIQINGYLKNETALFVDSGQVTGEAKTMLDDRGHDAGEVMKFENSARFFINGDIGEESSWHADLNIICDSKGVNTDLTCHKNYTQYDWLRELYIDTSVGDLTLRIGKQQVVWGTADGIKLLDIINPTDYREMSQNSVEDARIPIWMINAEYSVGETGNLQFILSENRANYIPGLDRDGARGQPFIMKGVDSITGEVNGFLHVVPALSNVAGSFNMAAYGGMFTGGQIVDSGLLPFAGLTVDGFASNMWTTQQLPIPQDMPGYFILNNIAQNGLMGPGDPNANNNVTNLMPIYGPQVTQVTWNPSDPGSAFEYMPNATFATFNTFTRMTPEGYMTGIDTVLVSDEPNSYEPNAGLRYRASLENGLNFGINYLYHYSSNPEVNMSWHDAVTGEELEVVRARGMIVGVDPAGNPIIVPNVGDTLEADEVGNNAMFDPTNPSMSFLDAMPTVLLRNSAGQYYGVFDPTTFGFNSNQNPAMLRMVKDRSRVHTLGGSMDYSMELGGVPTVVRIEVAYDRDEKQPVVDKRLMGIGDLSNAMVMEDMDRFSYVLGVDVTLFTNMMASAQFIQMRNLDYIDEKRTCTTQAGNTYDCSRYTADFSTVSMTNGMNKGWENKEYVSFFLSMPFGESQLGRWNNILMWEDGGGWWNRFDVEYSFTDELIGSAELNIYWGDENTTFGQFQNSSNAQVGIKYLWE